MDGTIVVVEGTSWLGVDLGGQETATVLIQHSRIAGAQDEVITEEEWARLQSQSRRGKSHWDSWSNWNCRCSTTNSTAGTWAKQTPEQVIADIEAAMAQAIGVPVHMIRGEPGPVRTKEMVYSENEGAWIIFDELAPRKVRKTAQYKREAQRFGRR